MEHSLSMHGPEKIIGIALVAPPKNKHKTSRGALRQTEIFTMQSSQTGDLFLPSFELNQHDNTFGGIRSAFQERYGLIFSQLHEFPCDNSERGVARAVIGEVGRMQKASSFLPAQNGLSVLDKYFQEQISPNKNRVTSDYNFHKRLILDALSICTPPQTVDGRKEDMKLPPNHYEINENGQFIIAQYGISRIEFKRLGLI